MNSGYLSSATLHLRSSVKMKQINQNTGKKTCPGFSLIKNTFKRNIILSNGGVVKFNCFNGYDSKQISQVYNYVHDYQLWRGYD